MTVGDLSAVSAAACMAQRSLCVCGKGCYCESVTVQYASSAGEGRSVGVCAAPLRCHAQSTKNNE